MSQTIEQWLETMLAGGAESAPAVYTALKGEFAATSDQPTGWKSQTMRMSPMITAQLGCRSARPLRINAQHVDTDLRRYIACEGPSRMTTHDFWALVWQERVSCIVSLNFPFEERLYPSSYDRNRETVQYWPLSMTQPLLYAPFKIACVDVQNRTVGGRVRTLLSDEVVFRVSKLRISMSDPVLSSVPARDVHICYYRWPDGRIPLAEPAHRSLVEAARTLVAMIDMDLGPAVGPVLVHCHAGIGRTGAFIVLDLALRRMRVSRTIDVHGLLERVRSKRPGAVINHFQYIWIHLVLVEQALHYGVLSAKSGKYRATADALWNMLEDDLTSQFSCEESDVAAWHSYRTVGQEASDVRKAVDAEQCGEEEVDNRRGCANRRLALFNRGPSAAATANASTSHSSMSSSSTIKSVGGGSPFAFGRPICRRAAVAPTSNRDFRHLPQSVVRTAPPQSPPILLPRPALPSLRPINSWANRRHRFYGDAATIRSGERPSANTARPSTSQLCVEAALASPSHEQLTRMMGGLGLVATGAVTSSSRAPTLSSSTATAAAAAAAVATVERPASHSPSRSYRPRRYRSNWYGVAATYQPSLL